MSPPMAISPITSPSAIRPPTPQPVLGQMQQYPIMNAAGNQLVQFIQGPQIIAQQQRPHIMQSPNQYVPTSTTTTTASKHNKLPQQILPKPSNTGTVLQTTTTGKTVITQAKTATPVSIAVAQPNQPTMHQQQSIMGTAQPQQQTNSPIILPGNINHPLLLNQMPVLVQQNAPQGVQLILRPPTPQLSAPSLVIHNSRPQQIQQQQHPQQLLRILNTNGQMQLATATPTFIMSSQANLIQQNLQSMKAQASNPLNSLQGLTTQTPQQHLAAAINSQIIGRSMAQIQNLQLNGNIAHIQMPNGLNGQFISQLPTQFQQSLAGFNQFSHLSSANFQQLAAAAAGTTFQSPPPQTQPGDMMVSGQNIHFTTQQTPITVSVAQPMSTSQIITVPSQQSQMLSTTMATSEPMRNPTPITIMPNSVIVPDAKPMMSQIIPTKAKTPDPPPPTPAKPAKKPKKPKAKKNAAPAPVQKTTTSVHVPPHNSQPSMAVQPQQMPPASVVMMSTTVSASTTTTTSASSNLSATTSTGKLDLANVMKLCGIMDDDDFMDTDDMMAPPPYDLNPPTSSSTNNDIMVTIPYSASSDMPYSITIPNMDGVGGNNAMEMANAKSSGGKNNSGGTTMTSTISANTLQDGKKGDRQYMIKIDNNDGSPGFPLSISLPQNMVIDEHSINKLCPTSSISMAPTITSSSHNIHYVAPQMNHMTTTTSIGAPTLQSQINEIQNQLMGVASVNNGNQNAMNTNSNVSATAPISAPSNSKAPKKKPAAKKNGKKILETINVPSQIGNIQISQVDSNKPPPNSSAKAQTIENQIQITPILDTQKSMVSQNAQMQYQTAHQTQTQAQQVQAHQSFHHIQTQQPMGQQQMSINLQPNQQILNLPNNVQIITSSNNNLNTQSIITSVASHMHQQQQHQHHANQSVAVSAPQTETIVINSGTPMQTANVQTIHQGNLLNANVQTQPHATISAQTQPQIQQQHQQHQQQQRSIQMTVQPQSNIQIVQQQTQNTHQPQAEAQPMMVPHLTGALTLSFSEDGRLILKHNPNAPQDAQSQMILQALLSGALCNVTLINEPLLTQTHTPAVIVKPVDLNVDVKTSAEKQCVVSGTFMCSKSFKKMNSKIKCTDNTNTWQCETLTYDMT